MLFVLVGVFGFYISLISIGISKGRFLLVCVILGKVFIMGDDWIILISGIIMYNDSGSVSLFFMLRIRYKIIVFLLLV